MASQSCYRNIKVECFLKVRNKIFTQILRLIGTQEGESLSTLVYLSKCNKAGWSRRETNPLCLWCHMHLNMHRNIRQDVIPLRMESCVHLLDDWIKQDSESSDPEINSEGRISRLLLRFKGRCMGFLPDTEDIRIGNNYMICKGDGATCFHARWTNAIRRQ
jgi:hypothetical protein